jgi:ribosomal protein S27AE
MAPHAASDAPLRCQRCDHLTTLTAHGSTDTTCLRGRVLCGTCGWWRPRRLSFAESIADTPQQPE